MMPIAQPPLDWYLSSFSWFISVRPHVLLSFCLQWPARISAEIADGWVLVICLFQIYIDINVAYRVNFGKRRRFSCWRHIVYFTAYQEWNFSFLTVTGSVKKLLVSHLWLFIYILWFWWHFHDMWVWLERWASSSWTANTLEVIVYFLIDDYHIRWRWSHLVERDNSFVIGE